MSLLCSISLSVLLSVWMQIHASPLNQYHQYVDHNGQFVWQSTSDFVPVQSQSFGNITIGHVMSMEFDLVWNGHDDTLGSAMFFRIGAGALSGGNGCFGNWNRYPALFITDDGSLLLYLSEERRCGKSYDLSSFGVIEQGAAYHIDIAFNESNVTVSVAEKGLIPRSKTWPRQRTPPEFIGSVVPIWWTSDKYGSTEYDPADATFSNVVIKSTVLSPGQPEMTLTHSVIESTSTPEPVGSIPMDEEGDTFVVDHDFPENAQSADHSSFVALAILTALLCFVSGCCLSWIGALHLQRTQSELNELGQADFVDAASDRAAMPTAVTPQCASSPDTESGGSSTVQIVIKSDDGVLDEEKEGMIQREVTPSGSSLYRRQFSQSSLYRISPRFAAQRTRGPLKVDVNVLRSLGENMELPVSPITVIREEDAGTAVVITPSVHTELTTPPTIPLEAQTTITEKEGTPPYYMD